MTTQQRLGEAINKALDAGFIDHFNYRLFNNDSSKTIIGGCAQTSILKGLGCTDIEISFASYNGFAKFANASEALMENINILHCVGRVTARAIAELLLENKIPELNVDREALKELAQDLPTRINEDAFWDC